MKITNVLQDIIEKLKRYFKRLLFPIYLFPLKLVTYTTYYLLRAIGRITIDLMLIIRDMIVFPFTSLRNFLKTLFLLLLIAYISASLVVMNDYFTREYGDYSKIFCSIGVQDRLRSKVVRIVGGYSEGSGFFISPTHVITNFHVINGESSPKIILPDGSMITPLSIVGDQLIDLAVLKVQTPQDALVMPLPTDLANLTDSEPLISTGYPLGLDLTGEATVLKGRFITFRQNSRDPAIYLQSDINVVEGMSGGPLTDQCGKVVGINAQGLAGLSLFIDGYQASKLIHTFTQMDVTQVDVDPTESPMSAVEAYYTYIMAHDMQRGFNLLSQEYLSYTTYDEWTTRFLDILYVSVIKTEMVAGAKDTVFVKFVTKSWTGSEAIYKYYEGVWVTKKEGDTYKMRRSMIKEVLDPSSDWFYSGPEF